MRKETIMKKLVSATVATAMVATLVAVTPTVQAEAATDVALTPWQFVQSGTTTAGYEGQNAWEKCYYTGVTTSAGEVLTEANFPTGTLDANGYGSDRGQDPLTVTTTNVADGFDATIGSNGWQANYGSGDEEMMQKTSYNNPWTVRAEMKGIAMQFSHEYTISFTASASKTKMAKIVIGDNDTNVMHAEAIKFETEPKEFTYTVTANNDQIKSGEIQLMLGAFVFAYREDSFVKDFISPVEDTPEVNWAGTVYISDFKIVDNGFKEMPKDPDAQNPDQKPGVQNPSNPSTSEVKAPAKAKISKVYTKKKASKKLKVKVKKVSGAAGYQFQVSKKKSFKSKNLLIKGKNSKKSTYTLKSSKLKNKKKLYVRVRAYAKKANGEKVYGAWSKSKKAKIK